MKLQKHARELLVALRELCAEIGGSVCFDGANNKGHYIFTLRRGTVTGSITCPSSPGDHRWLRNSIRNARKALLGEYENQQAEQGRAGLTTG